MSRQRVEQVVRLARRLADPADALGRMARERLRETSGLSPEGVELALTQHMETSPSSSELDALVAGATRAPRCHVVLSANVCTAAVRAVACAVACAPQVMLKPSRRDPVIAELLASELEDVELVDSIVTEAGDELHAYGSDESIAAIAHDLPAGVTVRAHGTGIGVAAVESEMAALADDIVAFDGRGCLSPRFVFARDAAAVGRALDGALRLVGSKIPRGPLDAAERGELARLRRTWQAIGEWHEGPDHVVAVDAAAEGLLLLPAYRAVLVVPWRAELLAPWRDHVTVVGGDGLLATEIAAQCPDARGALLGHMQKPPLDGPVDRRRRVNAVFSR